MPTIRPVQYGGAVPASAYAVPALMLFGSAVAARFGFDAAEASNSDRAIELFALTLALGCCACGTLSFLGVLRMRRTSDLTRRSIVATSHVALGAAAALALVPILGLITWTLLDITVTGGTGVLPQS